MTDQDFKNVDAASWLRLVGGATIGLGILVALFLIFKFSKPGMFSQGQLSGEEILIAVIVAAYHIVWAAPCFGIAQVLSSRGLEHQTLPSRERSTQREPAETSCPKCHMTFDDDFTGKFCDNCGTPLIS